MNAFAAATSPLDLLSMRVFHGRSSILLLCLATGLAPGCGDKSPSDVGRRLRVVAGAGAADTVDAMVSQPLVVEVRDEGGRPVAGVQVIFEAAPPADTSRPSERGMALCRPTAASCLRGSTASVDSTDASGRARALLRFGTVAGPAWVRVTVPTLGLQDSARYTVKPGAATHLKLARRDTSVYVGAVAYIGANTVDRHGNARFDAVTYSGFGSAATVDGAGTWHAIAIGRSGAVVRGAGAVDTAWLSVPPRGTIAGFYVDVSREGIAEANLDGSGFRFIVAAGAPYYGIWPDWLPDGSGIIYEQGTQDGQRILVTDTLGSLRRVTSGSTPTSSEMFATAAADGSIHFAAEGGQGDYGTGLWRAASVGATPVRIRPNPPSNANAWQGTPSPDGKRLAFMSVNGGGLTILDVANGAPTYLHRAGTVPRWSPTGEWIAYREGSAWYDVSREGSLFLIRPDGANQHTVSDGGFVGRAAWSPDGKWLIAKKNSRITLIELATGQLIPLAWAGVFNEPVWKP